MAGGLVALLDDVAALARLAAASVDDVVAGTMKASAKAAGVVIDDAAVTPQYVDGVRPERELPIVRRIAAGSIRNKLVFILPVILILSQFLPWVLTPLLMLGGTYLCYEGAEKVYEKVRGTHAEKEAPAVLHGKAAEDRIIRSAIITDLVLSAEIMVISLDQVIDESFWVRTAILIVVAIVITVGVYGAVGLLVKMDDVGVRLAQRDSAVSKRIGIGLVNAMPKVMNVITIIGTFAMLWVGGHIVLNGVHEFGFDPIHDAIQYLADGVVGVAGVGGFLAWLVDTVISLVFGLLWGLIIFAIVHPILSRLHRKKVETQPAVESVREDHPGGPQPESPPRQEPGAH
ncbi:DUF808 domain-containing protein [Flaviflexus huanghaiensis]|uniref:DUF808 domain-containing protein n=1 Tax=Flaviflexus huanghaiensis TaxID=1111473 RepID=UPI0015FACCB2|nr:DUF808 domain-containing protein [Flaviflexus huanghaiensis]